MWGLPEALLLWEDRVGVHGWHSSVPGGEEQCLPHLRVPVQGQGKAAAPGLEGGQNTRVNNPDLGKKRHGIFNDHKWLRLVLYISSKKQLCTF